MTPELIDAAVTIGLTLFGLVASYAAAQVAQRAGIDVEQTHIDRIKAAVAHVTLAAMADGKTNISEITSLSLAYLSANLPDAMAAVHPSAAAIQTISKAVLERPVLPGPILTGRR